jgi:translation initiation factor 2 beta subunit (eIF-2beta)/eIF-5
MVKKCFFCGSKNTKKNGLQNGFQENKCKACGRQFLSSPSLKIYFKRRSEMNFAGKTGEK